MMFHHRQEDHISVANKFSAPRLRYEVNALSRSPREDDFITACGPDVFRDTPSCFFVSFRGARAQRVQSAMHVGVFMLVIAPERIDYRTRFLRCCRAIKINQRMTMRLLAENREILADGIPVDTAGGNLVHIIICYTRCRAPLYSDTMIGCELPKHAQGAQNW